MKKVVFSFVLMFFSSLLVAVESTDIATTAEDVRPLLNGQTIPDVTLYDVQGNQVNLRTLAAQKPTVIIFYRGGWCPYCSAQLAGLKEAERKIVNLGYQLVAISPDSPEKLSEQSFDTDFKVKLLSDKNFEATAAFGVGFFLPEKTAKRYRNKMGVEFVDIDGTSRVALPVPAVYVTDTAGLVHFNYVNPNYKVRISPELLYQATKTLAL